MYYLLPRHGKRNVNTYIPPTDTTWLQNYLFSLALVLYTTTTTTTTTTTRAFASALLLSVNNVSWHAHVVVLLAAQFYLSSKKRRHTRLDACNDLAGIVPRREVDEHECTDLPENLRVCRELIQKKREQQKQWISRGTRRYASKSVGSCRERHKTMRPDAPDQGGCGRGPQRLGLSLQSPRTWPGTVQNNNNNNRA